MKTRGTSSKTLKLPSIDICTIIDLLCISEDKSVTFEAIDTGKTVKLTIEKMELGEK